MDYSKYKLVRKLFVALLNKGYHSKVVVTMFNNHKISGWLIDVNHNHFFILRPNGRRIKVSYTKVKKMDFYGDEIVKKVYEQINKNGELD